MINLLKKNNIKKLKNVNSSQNTNVLQTLGDLAQTGHSFYRFSQSGRGRSIENNFAKYIPGKITVAEDNEKYLSFVTEETIAMCFMYGDIITKLNFNLGDVRFQKIANVPVNYVGGMLEEYESKYLLVEQNYYLSDINTMEMLFGLVKDRNQLDGLFNMIYLGQGTFLDKLNKYKFTESAKLLKYLQEEYEKEKNISPEDIRIKVREYKKSFCKTDN